MPTGKEWDRRRREDQKREGWGMRDGAPAESDYRVAWTHGPRIIVLVLAMVALLTAGGFLIRKVFLPAEEALRRDVYEESKSYRDGTVRDLDNLRLEWLRLEPGVHRDAIAETARHRAADFPRDDLPERVREWLAEIGG